MKTFLKSLVAIGAVVGALLIAPAANAQQCGFSQFAGSVLGTSWTGLPEAATAGVVYVFNNSTVNNGPAEFLCRTSGEDSAGGLCPPNAGAPDDGIVVLNGNWGFAGVTGCPNGAVDGDAPNVALYTGSAGEGTASHAGKYVLISVGYSQVRPTLPHPGFPGQGSPPSLPADRRPALTLRGMPLPVLMTAPATSPAPAPTSRAARDRRSAATWSTRR